MNAQEHAAFYFLDDEGPAPRPATFVCEHGETDPDNPHDPCMPCQMGDEPPAEKTADEWAAIDAAIAARYPNAFGLIENDPR